MNPLADGVGVGWFLERTHAPQTRSARLRPVISHNCWLSEAISVAVFQQRPTRGTGSQLEQGEEGCLPAESRLTENKAMRAAIPPSHVPHPSGGTCSLTHFATHTPQPVGEAFQT